MAASNAFPATSTQDNMSMANQAREGTFATDPQNLQNLPQKPLVLNNPNEIQFNKSDVKQPGNFQNNMGVNPNMGVPPSMTQNQPQNSNPSNRLPSLSTSLPFNSMNNQPNMVGPGGMRIPSMFGNGMQMNGMSMGFPGSNPNIFQGGRMIPPGFNPSMGTVIKPPLLILDFVLFY